MMNGNPTMPILNENKYVMYFYYFVFTIIGQFYLLNMFIGVLFLKYDQAESKSKNKILTEIQSQWIKIQSLILSSKPEYVFYSKNVKRR